MIYCKNLKDFLTLEKHIIEKHIDYHKWCNHISDENSAVCDFIEKYGWIIREVYCNANCSQSEECELRKEKYSV